METTTIGEQFSSLSENVKEYVTLKLEYFKLVAAEKMTQLLTHLLISLVIFIMIMLIVLFLSFAFILWWGEYIGPSYIGALIVVGFYVLAGVLVYLLRYPLFINPLISKMSNIIMEDQKDE